jgi:iron(III) transport system substrate-binding protein
MRRRTLLRQGLGWGLALGVAGAGPRLARADTGEVVFYGFPGNHIDPLIAAFNRHHPEIKVRVVLGQGPEMLARLKAEKDRPQADVADLASYDVILAADLFTPYRSAEHAAFPDWAVIRKGDDILGYGFATSMQIFVVNTTIMEAAAAPKSWRDLMDPRFKGKYMVGNPALSTAGLESWSQMVQMYGRPGAEAYVDNAVFSAQTNLVPQNVGRGEVAIGLVEETKSKELERQDFPVALIYPAEGVMPTVGGIALVRNGPHPETARTFAEFLNSREAHEVNVAARNRRSPRLDAPPPQELPPMSQIKLNDKATADHLVADRADLIHLFEEIFYKKQKNG